MATHLNFVTLDVFTTTPYTGNPLAVVFTPPSSRLSQTQKQTIAREFNFSETIFVHPRISTSPNSRKVDIFTTTAELPFAGHPTIGAASWFLHHAPDSDNPVTSLDLKAGTFPINGARGLVSTQVAHNVRIHDNQYPLTEALRLYPSLEPYLTQCSLILFSVVNGMSQLLVELPSLEALSAVTTACGGKRADPSFLDAGWRGGGFATYFYVKDVADAKLGKRVIRTRAIIGTLEDPATGSAASGLAAFLSLREGRAGEFVYDVVQGLEMGRRSEIGVEVTVREAGRIESLTLSGSAVKVSEGSIVVPQD
ncbi:PhzF family phenazine biosynthesis protein [Aspergillus undulatus]|uniref:PhzF family phenazine biosynthesis protein n=1 Tax=Aspergillus undulatus TaxID=1810928 RepID=UPI003CCD0DEB